MVPSGIKPDSDLSSDQELEMVQLGRGGGGLPSCQCARLLLYLVRNPL